jgi:Zn-finger nucleic acid-binding protein
MNCPVCKDTVLLMTDKNGIEIDYCPNCRGVWLDRGELDKIIERTSAPQSFENKGYDKDRYRDDDYYKDDKYRYRKKKGGLLGELFDF